MTTYEIMRNNHYVDDIIRNQPSFAADAIRGLSDEVKALISDEMAKLAALRLGKHKVARP